MNGTIQTWLGLACAILLFAGCETAPIAPTSFSLSPSFSKTKPVLNPGTPRAEVLNTFGPPMLIHRDADPKVEYLHYHVIQSDAGKSEDAVHQYYIAIKDGIVTASGAHDDFDFRYRPAH